jgi:hypothetical protein
MDLPDLTLSKGTLPSSNSLSVAASLFVLLEGARTMQGMVGDDRFSHKWGGEIIGGTYVGVVGLLASVVVKSPLPAVTALGTVVFFCTLYYWEEERAGGVEVEY